jgi:hypothetical protein
MCPSPFYSADDTSPRRAGPFRAGTFLGFFVGDNVQVTKAGTKSSELANLSTLGSADSTSLTDDILTR